MTNPTFQHRHYRRIAAAIAERRMALNARTNDRAKYFDAAVAESDAVIAALSRIFADDNPNFDSTRFRLACIGMPIDKDKLK